jgi:hypothetical protein
MKMFLIVVFQFAQLSLSSQDQTHGEIYQKLSASNNTAPISERGSEPETRKQRNVIGSKVFTA